jgi:hypothetical protein
MDTGVALVAFGFMFWLAYGIASLVSRSVKYRIDAIEIAFVAVFMILPTLAFFSLFFL